MPAIEALVRARLTSYGPFVGLLGGRVGPPPLEQPAVLPAIVIVATRKESVQTRDGDTMMRRGRLRVTVLARTAAQLKELEMHAEQALTGWSGEVGGGKIDACRFDFAGECYYRPDPTRAWYEEDLFFVVDAYEDGPPIESAA
jgi:hypothetical protein